MFYLQIDGVLHGIVTLHVDDLQICGSDYFHNTVIKPMLQQFKFGEFTMGDFKCLGWRLSQTESEIISKGEYIENKMKCVEIHTAGGDPKEELNSEEKSILGCAIGKMRWVCDHTRPDVSFDELELSMKANKSVVNDVKLMNKLVNHIKKHFV